MGNIFQFIFQFIGTLASILSIPLAIYFYIKGNDSKYNKVREDIIKTLSYKIGEGHLITSSDLSAVYYSKLREYSSKKPPFSKENIIEDLISNVLSNPFLNSDNRDTIIEMLRTLTCSDNKDRSNSNRNNQILSLFISPFFIGFLMLISIITIPLSLLFQHRDNILLPIYSDYKNYQEWNQEYVSEDIIDYKTFIAKKIYKSFQNETQYGKFKYYNSKHVELSKFSKSLITLTENIFLLGAIIFFIISIYIIVSIKFIKRKNKILS